MARTPVLLSGIEPTRNLVLDPSFELDVVGTQNGFSAWNVNTANTLQEISDEEFKFGGQSIKVNPQEGNNYFYQDLPYGAGETWTLSWYVKCTSYVQGQLEMQLKGTDFSTVYSSQVFTQSTFDWVRFEKQVFTKSPDTAFLRLIFDYNSATPDFVYYIDGVQWELKDAASPYCDGAQGTGYSWEGDAHNSISSRLSRKNV